MAAPFPDVLVAGYGRPGNLLMFSVDRGVSFFGHWCDQNEGVGTQYDGSEYDSVVAVPPPLGSDGGSCSQILLTWANCTSKTACAGMGTFVELCRI